MIKSQKTKIPKIYLNNFSLSLGTFGGVLPQFGVVSGVGSGNGERLVRTERKVNLFFFA